MKTICDAIARWIDRADAGDIGSVIITISIAAVSIISALALLK